MKRLVIIDGKSVFYRGYYAMGALSTSDGTPTGGVYGFAAIAMEIVRQLDPTKVVVAWDSRTSTARRKEVYPEYKAGRVKPGDDFYAQIPLLEELVKALGWGFVECDDCEADDIIGTLALQAGEETALARSSSSADVRLAHRTLSTARSDAPASLNNAATSASLEPSEWEVYIVSSDLDMLQVVDENTRMYRILQGFSRLEELDVPAVEAKYGIKKAQFLDLKALKGDASDNIPGVPGIGEKTAVKLLNDYETLEGVYEALDAGKIEGKVAEKLANGRESAKMSKFLAKIMTDADVKLDELPELVIDDEKVVAALKKLEFRTLVGKFLRARGNAAEAVKEAKAQTRNALKPSKSEQRAARAEKMASAGLSQQTLEIPVELPDGLILSWNVKDLMHKNAKVAEKILSGAKFWDLAQGAFLLNPLARNIERQDEKAEYERQKAEFAAKPELEKILTEFDLPLIPVLYEMEETGMLIDRPYFEQLKEEFLKEVAGREREIWELAGTEFNVNSPAQLSEVLFTRLGLPTKGIKKGSRGYSTGAKELDKLQKYHPVIEKIKEYREVAKLLSTYIEPIPELADQADRVHTTFNQNVTATGRLSSTNPNLQNIPVRTEIGRQIRTGFIAGPGKVLVSADYSQFELRLAAVMAGDEALVDDFNSDVDIHTKTAAEAFSVAPEAVTKAQRRAAKVINFGVLYGMSVRGLSEAAGMSYEEAKNFIERYFELRKPVKEYLDHVLTQARELGYVETYYGRRRPTPDVLSSNFIVRTGAERAAQNMPIQGTEADLMKRAMLTVKEALPKGAEMIMQVHDSLIIECDEGLAEEVSRILVEKMENVAPELKVKLKVEVTTGCNWGEL